MNYEIEKEDVGKKKLRVVHVNNIKLYEEQVRVQKRIVVVTEEYSECVREKIKLAGRDLDDKAKSELETVLSKYKDVFSDSPGHTKVMTHRIVTESDIPVTSHPYRLCPQWKDKVKTEIELLLQAGIVCESTSSWSSPIVPVRKPDGTLRLCVDFRKVNAVTQADPFYMPLIEEIVDQLGEADRKLICPKASIRLVWNLLTSRKLPL